MIVEWPLRTLSICRCGFPLLNESIPLGTVYKVNEGSIRGGFTFICGGCQTIHQDIQVVDCSQILNPHRPMMPLPIKIFTGASTTV